MSDWAEGPPHLDPPAAEVHVWRADLDAAGELPAGMLAPPERERGRAIRSAEAARRWVASRWALREVLARYLAEDAAAVELAPGPQGKPRLAVAPERLEFNLSHSAGLALVAIAAGRPVGVDVERVKPRRDVLALAERGLEPAAAAAVRAAPPAARADAFYAAWASHEARLKCHGGGFGGPPPEEEIAVAALPAGDGYAAAVAVPGSAVPPLRLYDLDLR